MNARELKRLANRATLQEKDIEGLRCVLSGLTNRLCKIGDWEGILSDSHREQLIQIVQEEIFERQEEQAAFLTQITTTIDVPGD